MFRFRRWLLFAAMALGSQLAAQPPLTTVQDILYTADGNRFNGVATRDSPFRGILWILLL